LDQNHCDDQAAANALIDWLPQLAADPRAQAHRRLPGYEDVFTGWVTDSYVLVTFMVDDEWQQVHIVHIEPSPPGFGRGRH